MSRFLNQSPSVFGVWLVANDDRVAPLNYIWADTSCPVQLAPFLPGLLWSSSKFGGGGGGMGLVDDWGSEGEWAASADCRATGGAVRKTITGTTKDSTGAALGNCVVQAFLTADDSFQGQVTSDVAGGFTIYTAQTGAHYLTCYKVGSPDVGGTSVNTITPV